MQATFGDSEVLRDLTQRGFAFACGGDDVAAEFLGECFRHGQYPSTVRRDARRSDGKVGAVPPEQDRRRLTSLKALRAAGDDVVFD